METYGRLDPATGLSSRVADCLASLDLAVAAAIVYFAIRLRGGEPITSLPHADGHMPNNVTMYSRLKSALDRRIV